MDTPKPINPRQRLQTLLAIPERNRTDAEWDEINELEISLASSRGQHAPPDQTARRNGPPTGRPPQPGGGGGGGGGGQGGKRFKRSHKRPPKRDPV